MKVKVTNCLDCPFMIEEIDFDSVGNEVCIDCNLLKFLKLEKLSEHKFRFFDYQEWFNLNYLKQLDNCPLKNDKIEIK